jgi:hypothetical protein
VNNEEKLKHIELYEKMKTLGRCNVNFACYWMALSLVIAISFPLFSQSATEKGPVISVQQDSLAAKIQAIKDKIYGKIIRELPLLLYRALSPIFPQGSVTRSIVLSAFPPGEALCLSAVPGCALHGQSD